MVDTFQVKRTGNPNCDQYTMLLDLAFNRAMARDSHVSEFVLKLRGMSGVCYRHFINNLIRMTPKARYLEIGSWAGSTACSAIDRNVVSALCIDNWSQFGGPKDEFFANTKVVVNDNIEFKFIEDDFRAVDVSQIGSFNVYLFDGPHDEKDQFDGLAMYESALDDDFIFIVDDWNWRQVRIGTLSAIRQCGYNVDFAIEVRTTLDNEHPHISQEGSDWHNGYFLAKLSRDKRRMLE